LPQSAERLRVTTPLGLLPAQVEVHSVAEMRAALNDTSVDHVYIVPGGQYNFTVEEFPPDSVYIRGRNVTLEGGGPGLLRMDVSWRLPATPGGCRGRLRGGCMATARRRQRICVVLREPGQAEGLPGLRRRGGANKPPPAVLRPCLRR
jgi:hypothetical protein